MNQSLSEKSYHILYWLNGEELLDSDHATLNEAAARFAYLKKNWETVFAEGLTAIELTDQYFDEIEKFKPYAC